MATPNEAYLIDAVRTPVGRRNGGLSKVHPADLGAHVLSALVERTGIDAGTVDDVIFGCLDAIGPQAGNIARTALLVAGFPESVPGVTVDRQCGSSQQALHFAAQAVMSGTSDLVIAGGVQNMSQIPMLEAYRAAESLLGTADPFDGSIGWEQRYGAPEISQFWSADTIAERWNIDRVRMEEFALRSHHRALAAIDEGAFDREIVAYGDVAVDEGPRRNTSLDAMAALRPLRDGGRVTAAVSSQLSDASSAVLVASAEAVTKYGLTPRARIHHMSVGGDDPILMLTAPISATRSALKRAGLDISEIDLFEINEAFASVVLAWQDDLEIDPDKVNVCGGAIALGHPLGATGTKLMTTLLNTLERQNLRYGLQTMCEGGGLANVTIIEKLS
ncbi:acetyl-CoA acetyltransferase [Rhodococcus sp. 15-1154-1]|nr:acetyl-CoA C-acetyltransferase [Rhodococcus sp. 15-1154-1]OZF02524.1 acetyl-CoA acetyltransferase [Rhodococcus sp. 15-1154-1]